MMASAVPSSNISKSLWGQLRIPRLAKIGSPICFLAGLVTVATLPAPGSSLPSVGVAPRMAVAAQRVMLAGQLLVARDELRDPRFVRSVIYVVHHGATGAMGLIVNRPIGEASLSELVEQAGLDNTGITGKIRVHFGGPVEPGQGFVLHTADYKIEGTEVIEGGIAVTARSEILRAMGTGTGPRQSLFALGYAGWAPGQLEAEIKAGAWEIVPADKTLLFDENADTKWERAMARRTIYL